MNIDLKRSNSFNRCGRMLRFDRIKPLRRAGMRSQHVGAFAFVLVTLPFNASAYVLDFHGTTSEIYRKDTAPAVPAAISNATTWDVLGSIEFTDAEAAVINGGSLSINGISLGAFDTWVIPTRASLPITLTFQSHLTVKSMAIRFFRFIRKIILAGKVIAPPPPVIWVVFRLVAIRSTGYQ